MIAKKFQVFVSSTFTDLVEERKRIIESILDLDCIPAGMELFPSASQKALDIIKKVIDDSDYYILIIGGRYGSVDEDGLSYTELEYDYAKGSGRYILPFLHKNPGDISVKKSDTDSRLILKLEKFKEKIQNNHHLKYWTDANDLSVSVASSLAVAIRKFPGEGWVRGGHAISDEILEDYRKVRIENEILKGKLGDLSVNLSGGDDVFKFIVKIIERNSIYNMSENIINEYDLNVEFTWNEILYKCGSVFVNNRNVSYFNAPFKRMIFEKYLSDKERNKISININQSVIDSVVIQFIALDYLEPVSDSGKNFFRLTDRSRKIWSTSLAIKKTS